MLLKSYCLDTNQVFSSIFWCVFLTFCEHVLSERVFIFTMVIYEGSCRFCWYFLLFKNVVFFHCIPFIQLKIGCFYANTAIIIWKRNKTKISQTSICIQTVLFVGKISYRTVYINFLRFSLLCDTRISIQP